MTSKQAQNLIFFFYDNKMYNEVIKKYEKYDYLFENDNAKILYIISDIFVNKKDIIQKIKSLNECKETEQFQDIKLLQDALAVKCYDDELMSYEELMKNFEKVRIDNIYQNNPIFYFSPGIERLTTQKEDKNLEILNSLERNIDKPDFFKSNVNKLEQPLNYREMIKYSLKHDEFEYGLNAVKQLLVHFDFNKSNYKIENYKTDLSNYVLIVDFMKHYQQYGYKFLNSHEYLKVLNIFKDTPIEISVVTLSIIEESKEVALKKLNETIRRLKQIYSDSEINKYAEPFMKTLANIKG